MTTRRRRRVEAGRPGTVLRPERGGWWAMVMLLSFLAVSIAALLFSYFHLLIHAERWPPAGIDPPGITTAGIAGLGLLASALAVYLAVGRAVRGDRTGLKVGLGAGLVLGVAGTGLQLMNLVQMPFTAHTNVYGSLFFALGGYLVILLAAGLLMLATVQMWVWMGYFGAGENLPLVNTGLYWYFVVATWVPVYATLYLSPHILGGS